MRFSERNQHNFIDFNYDCSIYQYNAVPGGSGGDSFMNINQGYENSSTSSTQSKQANSSGSTGFTIVGIITFGIILWVVSQKSTGNARSLLNSFLGVLLLSMVLLNWSKIRPIFFK